jgi:hypothetical protein
MSPGAATCPAEALAGFLTALLTDARLAPLGVLHLDPMDKLMDCPPKKIVFDLSIERRGTKKGAAHTENSRMQDFFERFKIFHASRSCKSEDSA